MSKKLLLATLAIVAIISVATPVLARGPVEEDLDDTATTTAATIKASDCPQPVPWLENIGIKDGLLIPCNCVDSDATDFSNPTAGKTPCHLADLIQTIFNFTKIILALSGTAAIAMFTYAGVMMMIAYGNSEMLEKGKTIIKGAVIGVVIILTAYILVNTVENIIVGNPLDTDAQAERLQN